METFHVDIFQHALTFSYVFSHFDFLVREVDVHEKKKMVLRNIFQAVRDLVHC